MLPQYFQDGEDSEKYHSTGGDRVYGTLSIKGTTITYRFNDGQQTYRETKEFTSRASAENLLVVLQRK